MDNVGSSLIAFVLPLLILDISNSTLHLSIISSFSVLPFLFLGLPFGALVDKLNVKKILYLSDFIRFILYVFLAIILLTIQDKIIVIIAIYIVTIIVSCTNVLNTISEITFISYFVSEENFSSMNSRIYGIQYVAGMIIPSIGGLIYTLVDINWIFLFGASCFLVSSLVIFSMNVTIQKTITRSSIHVSRFIVEISKDIKQGFFYLIKRPQILSPLIIIAIFNVLTVNFQNDCLIILKNVMNFPTEKIGVVFSITSIGALMGTLIVSWLSKRILFEKLFFANIFIQLCLRISFIFFKEFFVLTSILFIIDICQSILNIIIITNRQKYVEQEYMGRVNSIYKTVLIGINSLGYLFGGFLTSIYGAKNGVLFSSFGIIFLLITGIWITLKKQRETN